MASESLPPAVVSRVMSEIRDLVRHPVEGIEYEEEDNTVSEVNGTISGVALHNVSLSISVTRSLLA